MWYHSPASLLMPLTSVGCSGWRSSTGRYIRAAVDLPRAGKDDLGRRVAVATRLQQRELAAGVDLQVGVGVDHAVGVANLPGQIEDEVLPLHQIAQPMLVAHVGDVDPQPIFEAVDVEDVAAVLRDQRIEDQHLRAQPTSRWARLEPMKPRPPVMRTCLPRKKAL
jgi:hypothetical protein